MTDIEVLETSGVDYPAHLHKGFIVMKSQNQEETMADETTEAKEDILKELPEALRKMFVEQQEALAKQHAELEAEKEALAKERTLRLDSEAIAKAKEDYANLNVEAESFGPMMRKLAELDAEIAEKVDEVLKSANSRLETNEELFKAVGTEVSSDELATESALDKMAKSLVEEGKVTSFEKAVAHILDNNLLG